MIRNLLENSNRILDLLPSSEEKRLLADGEVRRADPGTVICEAGARVRHLYFPLTCIISLLTSVRGHPPLEAGLVGNEGVVGASVILGAPSAPLKAVVQGAGDMLRVATGRILGAQEDYPSLHVHLKRYLFLRLVQMARLSACTHFHPIELRLPRLLLMMHDRSLADDFFLTQYSIAGMLGVRRSGVTIAAGALQSRELIKYDRGHIHILDRPGLQAASCECYEIFTNEDYQRLPGSAARAKVR